MLVSGMGMGIITILFNNDIFFVSHTWCTLYSNFRSKRERGVYLLENADKSYFRTKQGFLDATAATCIVVSRQNIIIYR